MAIACGIAIGSAQTAAELDMHLDPNLDLVISWDSEPDYYYHLWVTVDFESWELAVVNIEGDGTPIEYAVDVQGLTGLDQELANQAFFRVEVTDESIIDPYSFLALPKLNTVSEIQEGVCFSFNLNLFNQLPSKIRIYMKENTPSSNWAPIGLLQDFNEIDGVKFLQGSVVWLPDQIGDYQVKATAFDSSNNMMAEVERDVSVVENTGPSIDLVSGDVVTSSNYDASVLIETINHAENAPKVCFAEFFDGGRYIGRSELYYDANGNVLYNQVKDLLGNIVILNKGTHSITARVIDQRGVSGEVSNPVNVHVTQGNSRPVIEITSPTEDIYVNQGDSVTINFNFSDPDGNGDISDIKVLRLEKSQPNYFGNELDIQFTTPFTGSFTLDTSLLPWTNGVNLLSVIATDVQGLQSHPVYLTVYVKTGFEHNLITELVDENSISLTGKEYFQGNELSSGIFTGGNASGLGMTEAGPPSGIMDTGVALTTGFFSSWNGGDDDPINEDKTSYPHGFPGDEFLECRISKTSETTFDAAIIAFETMEVQGQFEIVYQFGSEEYIEFVTDNVACHNDAFLIIVDGSVVSLLPDCTDIVGTPSIHPLVAFDDLDDICQFELLQLGFDQESEFSAKYEHLYLDDDIDIDSFVSNQNQLIQVEYDGMTIPMKSHILLSSSKKRSIRAVISDVNDAEWDSALFLQAGSIQIRSVQ